MAAEIICDGCGRRAPMIVGALGSWHKPSAWYERTEFEEKPDGSIGRPKRNYSACSRECINIIAKETGTSSTVLPF